MIIDIDRICFPALWSVAFHFVAGLTVFDHVTKLADIAECYQPPANLLTRTPV